jgi:3-isopropylmalate/(R)-2-methylmalate dehydratase small subunit
MVRRIATIGGRGLPLRGDDIDTDRIIPGRFLKTVTFEGLEQHLFEDDRSSGTHPVDDPRYAGAVVLVVNANFGCGSSREHAPQALQRWGIQAIVGESFAEIFFGNSMMMGMPCLTASAADVRALQDRIDDSPATHLLIDLAAGTCDADGVTYAVALPPKIRDAFVTGAWDTTGMLRDRFEDVEATAGRLPYVSGF